MKEKSIKIESSEFMKKVELLSPVGNKEMLYQAIHNGADAIYLAGNNYGARKFAENFGTEELIWAIRYAHLYGVKVYVTVNTLIYENELESVKEYIEFLHENGVDALIMQDIGLIKWTRATFPNLEIHASTQCHNHNQEILSLWKELGITRAVLARELSLEEIKKIDVDIEKEVFVYGALCVCYSGCCLFSSLNGGRSGNRGECVGSCRLPYKLVKNHQYIDTKGSYLLSTKELNTLSCIKELIESGIHSFKIEGRMKSPSYVGYVTRLYRILIDKYYQGEELLLTEEETINLKKLFNRDFTTGYLFQDPKKMNLQTPNHQGVEIGKVIDITKNKIKIKLLHDSLSQNDGIRFQSKGVGCRVNRLYNQNFLLTKTVPQGSICYLDNKLHIQKKDTIIKTIDTSLEEELKQYPLKKIPISMHIKCFQGLFLELTITDGINTITEKGDKVEKAQTREVTKEEIQKQLEKLGNTPFHLENLQIEKDSNIFINLKNINETRRKAVNTLMERRMTSPITIFKKDQPFQTKNFTPNPSSPPKISILVRTETQLKYCLKHNIDTIYVADNTLYQKYKDHENIYYRVSRVNDHSKKLQNEKLLIGEFGSIYQDTQNNKVIGDYYLNITNHHSVNFLKDYNLERITLSVELNDQNIKELLNKVENIPVEMIIYGRLELMIMKYCPLKECLNYCTHCKNNQDKFYLEDKFGNQYPILRDHCLTHILHSKSINKINNILDYKNMGISHFRLELWEEEEEELEKLLKEIKNNLGEKTSTIHT